MIWLVGLILFAVELYVLLHTTYCKWRSTGRYTYELASDYHPIKVRVYHVLLLLLCNLWWISVATAVIFLFVYLGKCSKPCDNFCNSTGTIWRIEMDNFLTREITINRKKNNEGTT